MKVKHIVLFKFKSEVNKQIISECFDAIKNLKKAISGIESFTCGEYSSPEGLNHGFSHGFEMIFSSVKHRDEYLDHSEHVAIVKKLIEYIEDFPHSAIAFDYLLE